MYHHYLKPALRRIFKARMFSLITILSLAIGFSTCMLIYSFVRYESGFDSMHPDHERLYRLNWQIPETSSRFATFFNPLTPILAEVLPEIEAFSRLAIRRHVFSVEGVDQFAELSMVDDEFFNLFSYRLVAGDAVTAIRDMDSAILTEAAATKLFGMTDVLGRVFTVDGTHDFSVAAVVGNNPANSHLGSNIFVNIKNLETVWNEPGIWNNFGSDRMYHYVRLAPGVSGVAAADSAISFISANIDTRMASTFLMQPLTDIHFTTDLQNEMSMVDDALGTVKPLRQRSDLSIFASVGLLTLLIAALNFMNMQAVQFIKGAKETSVRRVAGASRPALMTQMLVETALISLLALLVAWPLTELLTPWFNGVLALPATASLTFTPANMGLLVVLAVSLGALGGLQPALAAARQNPMSALRGNSGSGGRAPRFRAFLIVCQFTISICLIIASVVVKTQIDYAYNKPLGFDATNVLKMDLPNAEARRALDLMKSQLLELSDVTSVSAGSTAPTRSLSDGTGLVGEGVDPDNPLVVRSVSVSEDYFATLGMEFVAGRALSRDFPTDMKPPLSTERRVAHGSIVLNESAARLAGWTNAEEAIGQQFYQQVVVNGENLRNDFTVVGVVADAHFGSIRREVEPVAYFFFESYAPGVMVIKLAASASNATLAEIEDIWRRNVPALPVQLSFLDADYSALYAGEARTFALFIALSTLAILIACSGLYGLATYTTERRTKEVGVRKVMGGSVWSIVLLLTNDFSKLVLLANVIAWPVAYIAMNRWLENFAYRTDLTPLVFIGSGLIALCIAWVTVGGTAARAANQKPVLALRYE